MLNKTFKILLNKKQIHKHGCSKLYVWSTHQKRLLDLDTYELANSILTTNESCSSCVVISSRIMDWGIDSKPFAGVLSQIHHYKLLDRCPQHDLERTGANALPQSSGSSSWNGWGPLRVELEFPWSLFDGQQISEVRILRISAQTN